MPQKHNPDVLELLRATTAKIRAAEIELNLVTGKLPSHYHRDFQYTKEPVIRATAHLQRMLPIFTAVISNLTINQEALDQAMTPDLYATYDAFLAVKNGLPFRDAYLQTATKIKENALKLDQLSEEFNFILQEAEKELLAGKKELSSLQNKIADMTTEINNKINSVLN